jgi:hypothetical protein
MDEMEKQQTKLEE